MYNRSLNQAAGRKIRLLHLEPLAHSSTDKSTLHGTLREVDLAGWTSYDAVSHVWGTAKPKYTIQIDQVNYSIRENCYSLLLRLRHPTRRRRLWVDSICINQDDRDEKSHQVAMMFDIYKNAGRVIIWLGPGTPHSDYAVEWCEQFKGQRFFRDSSLFPRNSYVVTYWVIWQYSMDVARYSMRGTHIFSSYVDFEFANEAQAIRKVLGSLPKLDYRLESLQDLFHREWFSRMWTVQEVAIARRPVFMCGEKVFSWGSLETGLMEIMSHEYNRHGLIVESVEAISFLRTQLMDQISSDYDAEFALPKLVVLAIISFLPTIVPSILATLLFRYLYGYPHAKNGLMLLIRQDLTPVIIAYVLFVSGFCLYTYRTSHPFGQEEETKVNLQRNLSRILWDLRQRQASDARDNVFALYGIFKEIGIELDEPDYANENIDVIYHRFTQHIIEFQGSLEVLQQVGHSVIPTLPSWVPDWSVTTQYMPPYLTQAATTVSHFTIHGDTLEVAALVCGSMNCRYQSGLEAEFKSLDDWGKPAQFDCLFNGLTTSKRGRAPSSARNTDVLVWIPGLQFLLLMRATGNSEKIENEFRLIGPAEIYDLEDCTGWPPDKSDLQCIMIV